MLACTATASARVREDVRTSLGVRRWVRFRASTHRKNLRYEVRRKPADPASLGDAVAELVREELGTARAAGVDAERLETRRATSGTRTVVMEDEKRSEGPSATCTVFRSATRPLPSVFATPASRRGVSRGSGRRLARRRTPRGLPAPFPSPSRPSRSAWASINRTFVSSCITRRASRSRRITRRAVARVETGSPRGAWRSGAAPISRGSARRSRSKTEAWRGCTTSRGG